MVIGDASFGALFVDVQYVDAGALAQMVRLAKAGVPVILKRAPTHPGLKRSPHYDRDLAALKQLTTQGLTAPPLIDGDDLPDFWCRQRGRELTIFFAHPAARGLKMPLRYRQADDARETRRRVRILGRETELRFPANQSLLLRVGADGSSRFEDIAFSEGGTESPDPP
jgi:hypothetical protein